MTGRFLTIHVVALASSACAGEQAETVAPGAFVGCYSASNAPSLSISPTALRAGDGREVPLRFEVRKVGLVLSTPLKVEGGRENPRFVEVEDNYDYRILRGIAGPRILVSPARGVMVSYNRVSTSPCPR